MNIDDDEVSSAEQMRRALALSREELSYQEDQELQDTIRRSQQDIPSYDDSETISRIERESLQAYFDDLAKKAASETVARPSRVRSHAGPAPELNSESTSVINDEVDRDYKESLRVDAEKERLEELIRQQKIIEQQRQEEILEQKRQHEILEQQRRAAQQPLNEETIRVFESRYLNGDVTVRLQHNAKNIADLKINVNTPINLLIEYIALKYNLRNVELFVRPNQLQPNSNLSNYAKSGERILIIVSAQIVAGGFNRRISRKNKINIRRNSNRQVSNRQVSNRQVRNRKSKINRK